MIRLGFALGCSLLLVATMSLWAPSSQNTAQLPEPEALEWGARLQLSELREVASSWLEPLASRGESEAPAARAAASAPADPQPVERVTPHVHDLADASTSEFRDVEEPPAASGTSDSDPAADAAPLGRFGGRDLDESASIVRRLLAIYARLERAQ